MWTSPGRVLNWSVPTATEMDALNTQVHIGGKWNHIKNIYRNDFPDTKGSLELLVDPVHGKEMQTNPQIYLKETH